MQAELSLGVVGAGRWGRHWVRVCSELSGARLGAVCEPDPARAPALPQGRAVPWFRDMSELLEAEVDALVIATPTSAHAPLALRALEAGRHVLVEKPLAGDVASAERIAGHVGARSMVGHLLRYHPAVTRMRQLIETGALGGVTHVLCDRLGGSPAEREETAWWALAPHDLSVMRHLFGAEPRSIHTSSETRGALHPEDAMTAVLSFPAGQLGVIRVGGESPTKVRRITVVGERRSVTFSDGQLGARLVHYDSPVAVEDSWTMRPLSPALEETLAGPEPLRLQAQHFVDCLRSGAPFASDAHDGVVVVRWLEAGSRSLREGRAVHLDAWPGAPGRKVSA